MSPHEDPGLWTWLAPRHDRHEGGPALFLDRDGVLVVESDFLGRPEDVVLLPGAAETIACFNAASIPVIVVTNQSGVGRGYFTWRDVENVEAEMRRQISIGGGRLDAVFACGYHPEGDGSLRPCDHEWRKPRPGMMLAAAKLLGLTLATSWVVGDRARDLEAGIAAGLAGGVHVMTGYGAGSERQDAIELAGSGFDVRLAADVRGARDLVGTMTLVRGC